MSVLQPAADARHHRHLTHRLAHVTRSVGDLARAEEFYCAALGFRRIERDAARNVSDLSPARLDGAAVQERLLQLGGDMLALRQPCPSPSPIPADSRSNDLCFQHLAIVVADMDRAYAHLRAVSGWRRISIGGPQELPARSGGARAFKFRDPDGHPLELLCFPANHGRAVWRSRRRTPGVFLGIDHTALSISETRRSLRFYADLGWKIRYRSLNYGTAQARLDDLQGARVRVLGLRAASPEGPGIELLAYRPPGRTLGDRTASAMVRDATALAAVPDARSADPAAPAGQVLSLTDPDGHRVLVLDQPPFAGPSMTNPKPPTSPKFFRNSQK